jgi:hypothetical protein
LPLGYSGKTLRIECNHFAWGTKNWSNAIDLCYGFVRQAHLSRMTFSLKCDPLNPSFYCFCSFRKFIRVLANNWAASFKERHTTPYSSTSFIAHKYPQCQSGILCQIFCILIQSF